MWINKPFFKYAAGILLTILIIYLLGKMDYFFAPFQKMIATIFFPILIAGLLYYIVRPLVKLLSKFLPKTISILAVFATAVGVIFLVVHYFGPAVSEQVQNLSSQFPNKVKEFSDKSEEAIKENDFGMVKDSENIQGKAIGYFQSISSQITGNLVQIFSTITSIATVLIIVPFILFYFLKDDEKLKPFLLKYIPNNVENEGNKIVKDVDKTLSTYIVGQLTIAVVDGVLMYIGYMIIGLDYAIVLALFAMFLTVVPFLGPFIGIIPALFVALQHEPIMALKVLLVLVIVQQLEGNLVTPHVMGKRLQIHPLTIILLLLVAGSIYGFIGILIAIPLYSVIKTLVKNFRLFYRLRQRKNVTETADETGTM
ncbi:AI-2E family transporter [Peribacillus cavernae]|uniref:AI-2E family transporter n=1 Tax=Peribacillus cavernae TaxID=1674310 RepID=A0A433HRN9_9BACI|nr:AI-2E family transporter [Peribacillus cavernae]MDQ0218827.1 putative PurR-regulated permease PerM [Peribacillus cavernae]RUQ31031.1 AI-2E family transporter [Peribacillus cavernae]